MADLFNEMLNKLDSFSDEQINELLSRLEVKKSRNTESSKQENDSVQKTLACHQCGSVDIVKIGHRNGKQRYRCKDCGKTFGDTNSTMLYHSRLSADNWRELLRGLIQNMPLRKIAEATGLNLYTVWLNKQKVFSLVRELSGSQDRFIDIAEADEYYVPLSFKGKRDPEFFIYTLGRMPRHHRTYSEKVEYLKRYGMWDNLQSDPIKLEQLLANEIQKRGISNDQVCVLTCKDRNNNLYLEPICLGRLESNHVTEHFHDRFESDAIIVTDSHAAYREFARNSFIQLEQIPSGKHAKGAYNLGRINACHSKLAAYLSADNERHPATKYLDLNIAMFRWLEKHGQLGINASVECLYRQIEGESIAVPNYAEILHRNLQIDTKNLIPTLV